MATKFKVKAAAIDLDGTLLDTLPDIAEAADRMLRELGRPAAGQAVVRDYIGNGIPRLVKRLLTGTLEGEPEPEIYERGHDAFQKHYRDTFLLTSAPYPGVVEGLERMREVGLQLACVTNKAEAFTLPLLAHCGLASYFGVVIGGDTLPEKKPHPLPLRHVAQRFGVAVEQVLVIGDSHNDAEAARAAGCPVVCVPYGYRGGRDVRELDCDAIVSDLIEASSLIA